MLYGEKRNYFQNYMNNVDKRNYEEEYEDYSQMDDDYGEDEVVRVRGKKDPFIFIVPCIGSLQIQYFFLPFLLYIYIF